MLDMHKLGMPRGVCRKISFIMFLLFRFSPNKYKRNKYGKILKKINYSVECYPVASQDTNYKENDAEKYNINTDTGQKKDLINKQICET